MFKFFGLILASLAVCQANIAVDPPVLCGPMPSEVYTCLGAPQIIKPNTWRGGKKCDQSLPECERMTCLFRKSGWMDGDKVDKTKLSAHFDQIAREQPEWEVAVQNVKANCLAADLPAQGIHINCPAYDITTCSFASFIKNAQPTQWLSAPKCQKPRQFVTACPICPSECFASMIPIGSCNACLSLPRSP